MSRFTQKGDQIHVSFSNSNFGFPKKRTSYAITDREGHSGIEEELFYSPAETKLP